MTGTVVQDAGAMAECILHLSKNVAEEKDMLYGTEKYSWDEEHDLHNKFYMHYSLYDPSADPLTSAVAESENADSATSDSSGSETGDSSVSDTFETDR